VSRDTVAVPLTVSGALLLLCVLACLSEASAKQAPAADSGSPNVLVVMTDDQTAADMRVMPKTRQLIGERGTTFENSFTNYPLCCPSRATFLTGQYAHNHGIKDGNFSDLDSTNTLPVWLQSAGYHTGHVGKYINGYGRGGAGGPEFVPPGWNEWHAALPNDQAVFDYDLNEDGIIAHYGSTAAEFKGDVLTARLSASFAGMRPRPHRSFSRSAT
jgi:N-acetylglucosamine-6-sulfatase